MKLDILAHLVQEATLGLLVLLVLVAVVRRVSPENQEREVNLVKMENQATLDLMVSQEALAFPGLLAEMDPRV